MRSLRSLIALALLALVLLAGCDKSSQQIVGKWKAENSNATWEFLANGSLDNNGAPGRYTFGDNKRLKIQTGAATFVYQYDLQNDRLTLIDPSGSRLELVRIR